MRRSAVLLTVVGAALAMAVPATAAYGGQVVTKVSKADRASALSYWTPDRMRTLFETDEVAPAETISKLWKGPLPTGVGRLFFTKVPGGDETCTATVVPSRTKDVAFTAGHCVNGGLDPLDRPVKVINLVFVPGYDHAKTPYGIFPVRAFAWSKTYEGPSSRVDDDAVIALDPVGGKHVADVAGTQDISFDKVPSPANTTILGYPVSELARGQALVSCVKPATLKVDSVQSFWETNCDLAGGASGGPWLRNFNPATGNGTIFAVTSGGTTDENNVTLDVNSAAFTDAVRSLYQSAGEL
ncbi:hypothetical protein LWC34_29305 [Kibdelosporangium philippinense]|uniref:Trypsin n=1 Tax=Kibdelosporangium philippinense TaxID=211113 RepID=A0ABS8ZHQ5_9PSEU|nr:hypothetical protein [Kibdelosporangium philippinense]MCE7006894.1 hypothetical protein [Kibdelosporangium philippinense]